MIEFYVPEGNTIPIELCLYVDNVYVTYERTGDGFRFRVFVDDKNTALKIVETIVETIKAEQSEPRHGVSWRTVSMNIVPQDERYKCGTLIEWKYRVRDSY